ncbi:MAG: hypothetical protein KDD39_03930 [Bdellovibrionales bacterium]|nr:hypothetical protein [Bdellovibrionales bacterium]
MKSLVGFLALSFLVVSCGDRATEAGQPAANACPAGSFGFSERGFCADVNWVVGPTSTKRSAFSLKFWDAKDSSKVPARVDGVVTAFIRMTCCGTVAEGVVAEKAPGEYEVTGLRFMPGEWDVFVQIKSGDQVEKSSRRLQVE